MSASGTPPQPAVPRSPSDASNASTSTTGAPVVDPKKELSFKARAPSVENIAERLFQVIRKQEAILEKAGIPLTGTVPSATSKTAAASTVSPAVHAASRGLNGHPSTATPVPQRRSGEAGVGYSAPAPAASSSSKTVTRPGSSVSRHVDPASRTVAAKRTAPLVAGRTKVQPTTAPSQAKPTRPRVANVQSPESSPNTKQTAPVAINNRRSSLGGAPPKDLDGQQGAPEPSLEEVQELLSERAAQRGVGVGATKTPRRFKPVSARKNMSGRRSMGGHTPVGSKSPKLTTVQGKLSKLKQRREAVKLQKADAETGTSTAQLKRPRLQADVQNKMAELEQLQQHNAKQSELPRERLRREPSRSAPTVARNSAYPDPHQDSAAFDTSTGEHLSGGPPTRTTPAVLPVKPIWDPAKPPAQILPPEERRQYQRHMSNTGFVTKAPPLGTNGTTLKHEPLRRIASSTLGVPNGGAAKRPAWSSSTQSANSEYLAKQLKKR